MHQDVGETVRKVGRYQRGNQKGYNDEGQTIQLPKDKNTKGQTTIYKKIHRKLQIEQHKPQWKPGGEVRCSRDVSSSCSICGTLRATLVTNSVISHEWRNCDLWFRQMEHISSHLWHRYSVTVNQVVVATTTLLKWWLQLND